MTVMTTRMFTHTGPRRGDVFAESTFAKQIAMIEAGLIEPVIKVGNLDSLRTWSDVRDAVRAYYMLVTENPTPGEYYNIGGFGNGNYWTSSEENGSNSNAITMQFNDFHPNMTKNSGLSVRAIRAF